MGQKKTVGILGYYGRLNLGDELILHAMLGLLAHHRLIVFAEEPENVRRLHGVEEAYRFDALAEKASGLDLLLLGGGGVLHRRYVRRLFPDGLEGSLNVPIIVFAAGVPFLDWCDGLQGFLDRCSLITLRESSSLPYLRTLTSTPVMFLPDPAYLLPYRAVEKIPGKVAVNIRRVPVNYRRDLSEDADAVLLREAERLTARLREEGRPYAVLGFSPEDEEWAGPLGGKIVGIDEAVREIGSAELLVGTRLHAGIIAATQGTPALMLDYQRKVTNLADLFPRSVKCVPISGLDLVGECDRFEPVAYNPLALDTLRKTIERFVETYIEGEGPPGAVGGEAASLADLDQWRAGLHVRIQSLEERLAQVEREAAQRVAETRRQAEEKLSKARERAAKREAELKDHAARQQEMLERLRASEAQLTERVAARSEELRGVKERLGETRRDLLPHRYPLYLLRALLRRAGRVVAGAFGRR